MDATRRGLLVAVPAGVATTAVAGCSLVSGSDSDDRPPYVVENESGSHRDVDLRVWTVGPVDPFDERPDSVHEEFEAAAADGTLPERDYEWRDDYDLSVDPGATATPLDE